MWGEGIKAVLKGAHTVRMGIKAAFARTATDRGCCLCSRGAMDSIRRCTFSNLVFYGSNRGIGIFAHNASDIEEILFSNILIETRLPNGQWWDNGEPIHLSTISRFEGEPVGQIRNVRFGDIFATSEYGILMYGDAESPMENIYFDNVDLKIVNGKETLAYGGNFDLRPATDIDRQLFEHDIPGIYAKHVNGLTLDDVAVRWGEGLSDFFTYALETLYVNDLQVEDFLGTANPASKIQQPFKLEKTQFRENAPVEAH